MFVSPFHENEKGILNLYLLVIELPRLLLYGKRSTELNGLSKIVTGVRVTCGTEGVKYGGNYAWFVFFDTAFKRSI
jgi:hypothetical protein